MRHSVVLHGNPRESAETDARRHRDRGRQRDAEDPVDEAAGDRNRRDFLVATNTPVGLLLFDAFPLLAMAVLMSPARSPGERQRPQYR
ncbi:MAG: hypothetical protein U9N84_15715 [Actinomycetota bacterium]|nr:hypothetical protein [Actinomycetota bacterium]